MPSTVGIVASAVWTPLDLAPALWLDASDPATITANAGAVSQWADKSGHDRHVTQATAAYQPATGAATWNGRNVIVFAGDYLSAATAADWTFMHDGTEWTLLVAVNPGPAGGFGNIVTTSGASAYSGFQSALLNPDTLLGLVVGGTGSGSVIRKESDAGEFPAGTPVVVRMDMAPANSEVGGRARLHINGVAVPQRTVSGSGLPPSSAEPQAPLGVGGTAFTSSRLVGELAEILIVPRALTATETTTAETYLSDKWGI